MGRIINASLVAAALALTNHAHAATGSKTYQYIPDAGSNIEISAVAIWMPDNFTGTVVDPIYGIYELFGDGPVPSNVYGGGFWIDQSIDPTGFTYRNPSLGIRFFEQTHNLIFWGAGNSWQFVDGKVVSWSLIVSGFKGDNVARLNDSIGGTWELVGNTLPIPEPSSYALLTLGLGLLSYSKRRKTKAS